MSRVTRFLAHETPVQVHRSVLVFHVVSLLDGSEPVLKVRRGS